MSHPRISVKARILPGAAPMYASPLSSGSDLTAYLPDGIPMTIAPGQRVRVPTGLRIEIPDGWEAQVRSRSGLAYRHGVVCLNSPGTIDADYRGEILVILANLGEEAFEVVNGMRIAQLVFSPIAQAVFEDAPLSDSQRGAGGFGSTGMH